MGHGTGVQLDSDARNAFSQLVANGYVDAVLAGNALELMTWKVLI